MLYTIVMDYRGGTYVSQTEADDVAGAVRAWALALNPKEVADLGHAGKAELIEQLLEGGQSPVSLEGVVNVWCTSCSVSDELCLINIVSTVRGSIPSLERFSRAAFDKEYSRAPSDRSLSDQLQDEIQALLHETTMPAFQVVACALNSAGHNLRHYGEPIPGDISLRDESNGDAGYHCDLRVGVDTVISVGFRDTVNLSDLDEDV